jgi:hypothetical protein
MKKTSQHIGIPFHWKYRLTYYNPWTRMMSHYTCDAKFVRYMWHYRPRYPVAPIFLCVRNNRQITKLDIILPQWPSPNSVYRWRQVKTSGNEIQCAAMISAGSKILHNVHIMDLITTITLMTLGCICLLSLRALLQKQRHYIVLSVVYMTSCLRCFGICWNWTQIRPRSLCLHLIGMQISLETSQW